MHAPARQQQGFGIHSGDLYVAPIGCSRTGCQLVKASPAVAAGLSMISVSSVKGRSSISARAQWSGKRSHPTTGVRTWTRAVPTPGSGSAASRSRMTSTAS